MRTVNIGELKNQLSAYLQYVRSGEEVIVRDRNVAVARILPIQNESAETEEAELIAAGILKAPERTPDWEAFWSRPRAAVSKQTVVEAAIESRGDR